jgi:hypothetical protein
LIVSPDPVLSQSTVSLTATVYTLVGTPTGSVVFLDGNTPLGTANLNGGIAVLGVSTLTVGSHSITATYSGDGNFSSVTSGIASETILDFVLNPGGSALSATVQAGGTASYTFPIDPSGAILIPAAVSLSAIGQPTGATVSFTPSSLPSGSGPTSVTMTIQVPQTAMLENDRRPFRAFALVTLSMLLPFTCWTRRSRNWLGRLTVVGLLFAGVCGVTILTGCGGNATNNSSEIKPRTYTINITATAGALSHSTTATLIVQ